MSSISRSVNVKKNLFNITRPVVENSKNKAAGHRFFAIDPKSGKRIKASFRCPIGYKNAFSGSHCLLPISVGQLSHGVNSPHEGAKFESTIELINKAKFGKCTILVDDTIQLDTYKILHEGKNFDELQKIVLSVGDEWIQNHREFYKRLEMPYEVKRWESVENDPEFMSAVEIVQARYLSDELYRNAFDENINEFLNRLEKRGIQFDQKYAFNQCWSYLTKENAGMGFVWPKWGANFEIYPSGRNASMSATYKLFVNPCYPNVLQPVSLRFQKSNVIPVNESDEITLPTLN